MKRIVLFVALSLFVCVANAQKTTLPNKITFPNKVGKTVIPETIPLKGGKLIYSCEVHPSVGSTFDVEFDKNAFTVKVLDSYEEYLKEHPEAIGLCGGDSGTLTYTLRPKKKGKFIVYEVEAFRGKETKRTKHIIIVK